MGDTNSVLDNMMQMAYMGRISPYGSPASPPDPAQMAMKQLMANQSSAPNAVAAPPPPTAPMTQGASIDPAFLSSAPDSGGSSDAAPLTSGRAMEGKSRASIDDLLSGLYANQKQQGETDKNLAWMQFFSKMAASPSSSFLGAAGQGADAMATTMQAQEATRRQNAQALAIADIKNQEWEREQKLKEAEGASKSDLEAAQAKYYGTGGAQANRIIPVVGLDGTTQYVKAGDALTGGYKPVAGYNNMNVTLTPDAIDASADALHNGATAASITGFGSAANRTAILNRFSEKYPGENLANAQIEMVGNKAGARTIGTAGGKIELAAQSLHSIIPLAKDAAAKIDSTEYPSINAVENAVRRGTGDPNIIALNTYLNAVQADHAALLVRTGQSTDTAREKARQMANDAMSKGQLGAYFDAVDQEIAAQERAITATKHVYGGKTPNNVRNPVSASPAAPTKTVGGKTYQQVNGKWFEQ